jgi:hypothetical protein
VPIFLRGNYIFTSPGQKAFLVSSNYVNYVELGRKGIADYYLEAKIENDEFVISGRLYDSHGNFICALRGNHLEEMQRKCKIVYDEQGRGYKVIDDDQKVLMELYLRDENTCIIKGEIYDNSGKLVAKGNGENFLIFKGPAVLGKKNGALGIVIE